MARGEGSAVLSRRFVPGGTNRQDRRSARPELEVVERRPRVTRTAVLVTLGAVAVAFGTLSIQISLIHRQQQLDTVRSQITDIQLANKQLREQESRLQSPSEILRIARDDLGMVEARPAELVTPPTQTVGAAADAGSTTPAGR